MLRLADIINHHSAAALAGGVSASLGVAGALGHIPEGISPIVWMVITLIGPSITAGLYGYGRVRAAGWRARKQARAAERRRIAEETERQAAERLGNGTTADDEEGRKLLEKAARERELAAADEAEAEAISKEAEATRR